jgi:hypothetical protein
LNDAAGLDMKNYLEIALHQQQIIIWQLGQILVSGSKHPIYFFAQKYAPTNLFGRQTYASETANKSFVGQWKPINQNFSFILNKKHVPMVTQYFSHG